MQMGSLRSPRPWEDRIPLWKAPLTLSPRLANGQAAALEYVRVTFGGDTGEREAVRRNLEAYCGLDTYAMLAIIRALRRAAT
jgi:hypothetical protein